MTDPFRVADVAADSLKDDPARLRDEAAALPFFREAGASFVSAKERTC